MLSANLTSLTVKMPKTKVMSTDAITRGQAISEPTVKYGINPATWAEFAKSRQTPNWQVCQI